MNQTESTEDRSLKSLRARPVLRDEAYRQIMQLLLSGNLKSGYLVSQRELTELTGSPIGAIREALKRLEAEAIVELIPQRGVKIREVTPEELHEVYQLRAMIEIPAVRHLCKVATTQEIASLRAKSEEIASQVPEDMARNADHFRQKATVDEDFHFTIVGSLGNKTIDEVYTKLNNQLRLSRINVQPRFSESRPAMREHLAVLCALEQHDADAAAQALRDHLDESLARALGLS